MKLVLLGLLSPTFSSLSQTYDALTPYIKTRDIIQDTNGYIWFAGQKGLSRFDGSNVITFSSQSEQWKTPFTWIHDLALVENHLIISTDSQQLWKFNPKTAESVQIPITLPTGNIYGLIEHDGKYFINITDEIHEYSLKDKTVVLRAKNLNVALMEKTNNNLYIAGKAGLHRLKNNSFEPILKAKITSITSIPSGILALTMKTIHYFGDDGSHNQVPNLGKFTVSTKSNDEQVIIINKNGNIQKLSIPNLKKLEHKYPDFAPLIPKKMFQDNSKALWVLSNQGIKKVSPSSINNHPKIFDVATNDNVITLFENKIIIGTYGDGIHTFNNVDPELSTNINQHLPPLGKKIMDLLAIENKLYIATFDGLWIYDADTQSTNKVQIPNNNKILLRLTRDKNLLYIATNDDGVFLFDLTAQKIVDQINTIHGISSSEIIDVMPVGNQKVWLATPKGIDIYNLYTKKVQHIDIPGQSKVISFTTSNNKIYASTKGDGLFVLNFHGEILSRLGVGVDFSHISTINNEVWAPAHHGLYRINTINNTMSLIPNTETYTFSDSPVQLGDKVYITHFGGILEVKIEELEQLDPIITVSETNISGKYSISKKAIHVTEENDVISLTLASLDYRSSQNKKFQYKINDGKWNNINNNQLTFTGLKSGDYAITIKGTDSLGLWSNKKAFAEIKVKYSWYATQEIKIVYFVIIVLLILITFRLLYLRSKSIVHVHNMLSNDIHTKGKSTFNVTRNLIQIKELILKNKSDSSNEDQDTILKFVENSIKELTFNEEENEPNALFGKSLDIALPYFSDYIHKKYHVNLSLEYNIKEVKLTYELQSDVYRIVYEAITSAVINSSSNNFEVSIQEFKQKLWLTISNNENSFSNYNNKVNFDMSMYLIRQLTIKHRASINVFDKETSGSQIVISIPLMSLS